MYSYFAFGLNIASAIEFPELMPDHFLTPDVVIKKGKVPDELQQAPTIVEDGCAANEQEYLWQVDNVCKYYAANGNLVVIEPAEGIDGRSVRLYLLATVMAAILHQRRLLPLHASAFNINGKLTLVTGDSGAGKSTTSAFLVKRNYQIFSDDVIVLHEAANQPIAAVSSYPMMKLWEDTIEKVNDDRFSDRTFCVTPGLNKYGFFFHDQFDKNAYPIERIFILRKKETGPIECRRLKNADAFKALNDQAYRGYLLYTNELRMMNFRLLSQLSREAAIIEIIRPIDCNPEELVTTVESFF